MKCLPVSLLTFILSSSSLSSATTSLSPARISPTAQTGLILANHTTPLQQFQFHYIITFVPETNDPMCCLRPPARPPEAQEPAAELLSFEEWKEKQRLLAPPTDDNGFHYTSPEAPPRLDDETGKKEAPRLTPQEIIPNPQISSSAYFYTQVPLTDRFNYASSDCSARIQKHHSSARSASAVLISKKDKYMLSPCTSKGKAETKFIVVELCDHIRIDTVQLANFEFFSGVFKEVKISVAQSYNSESNDDGTWEEMGRYEAKNVRAVQTFHPLTPLRPFYRYIRIDFMSHYANEYYCPVSLLRVYGVTEMEEWKWELWAASAAERVAASTVEVIPVRPEAVPEVQDRTSVAAVETPAAYSNMPQTTTVKEEPAASISSTVDSTIPTVPTPTPTLTKDDPTESATASSTITQSGDQNLPVSTTALNTIENPNLEQDEKPNPTVASDLPTVIRSMVQNDAFNITSATESCPTTAFSSAPSAAETLPTTVEKVKNDEESTISPTGPTPIPSSPAPSSSIEMTPEITETASSVILQPSGSPSSAASTSETSSSTSSLTSSISVSSQIPSPTRSTGTQALSIPAHPSHNIPSVNSASAPSGESVFRTLANRIAVLENNATLYMRYVDDQTRSTRDLIRKLEEDMGRLEAISNSQATMLARAMHELMRRREEMEVDRLDLVAKVDHLASEVQMEKRLGVAQLVILITVLVFMALTRTSRGDDRLAMLSGKIGSVKPFNTQRRRVLSLSGDWGIWRRRNTVSQSGSELDDAKRSHQGSPHKSPQEMEMDVQLNKGPLLTEPLAESSPIIQRRPPQASRKNSEHPTAQIAFPSPRSVLHASRPTTPTASRFGPPSAIASATRPRFMHRSSSQSNALPFNGSASLVLDPSLTNALSPRRLAKTAHLHEVKRNSRAAKELKFMRDPPLENVTNLGLAQMNELLPSSSIHSAFPFKGRRTSIFGRPLSARGTAPRRSNSPYAANFNIPHPVRSISSADLPLELQHQLAELKQQEPESEADADAWMDTDYTTEEAPTSPGGDENDVGDTSVQEIELFSTDSRRSLFLSPPPGKRSSKPGIEPTPSDTEDSRHSVSIVEAA